MKKRNRKPDRDPTLDHALLGDRARHEPEADLHAETKAEVESFKSAFQKRAKAEEKRFTEIADSAYWVAFCFESREQKEEFLTKLGLLTCGATPGTTGDKYVDGLKAAEVLGVKLESPRVRWPRSKGASERLTRLT